MQDNGPQPTVHPIMHHGSSFFKKNRLMMSVFGLVAMVVTVAGVFTSVWMTQQSNDIRSDAATDVFVDFTFGTPTQTIAVNQQGSTTIKVNTAGHKISGAAIYLKYDPQYLQVMSLEKTNHFPTVLETAKVDNTAGTASIILGSSASETTAGTFEIATLTFKVLKATTNTKITFDAGQVMATVTDNPNNVANVAGDATVMSSAAANPTAEVNMPGSNCTDNAANKKYKIGTSVVFGVKASAGNPAATESRVFIAKVDAAGTGLVNQGAEGSACLNGTGTISGPKGFWCKIATNAISSGSFTGNVTWNASVAGKFVVTTNAIVPNGVSCSGNPTCDYNGTDSPFTKSSCTGFVNCSNNDWHIFEVIEANKCGDLPSTATSAEIYLGKVTCSVGGSAAYEINKPMEFKTKATFKEADSNKLNVLIGKVVKNASGKEELVSYGQSGSCLNGGTIVGAEGYWCQVTSTSATSSLDKTFTWTPQTAGKFVVAVNAIHTPTDIGCSGNPRCSYSTDSPFAHTENCSNRTNCSSNDWHTFEVLSTAACTATPLPSIGAPSLDLSFKLQGLRKAGIKETATIQVKYVPKGQTAAVTKTYTKEYTSDATGVLKAATPLALADIGVTVGSPITGAKVIVKVPTSLAKVLGTVTLTANQTVKLESTEALPVGDFKRDPAAEANIIKYNDLALAVSQFKALENPVNNNNRVYDVNFDGVFNLQDLAIVLTNFDQLEYPGDAP